MRTFICVLGLIMITLVITQAENRCICVYPNGIPNVPGGAKAYWQFDEGSGSLVHDSTGNGNNGTTGGATWTTDAHSGYALRFDGNDRINVGIDPLGINMSNAFSLSLWFKFPTAFLGYFFKRGEYIYPFQLYNYSGRLGTGIRLYSGTDYLAGTNVLSANTWYHCVLTFRNGERKLYLNGQLNASNAPIGMLLMGEDSQTTIGEGFTGIIDEVSIYDRVLSASEVLALYNNTKTRIIQIAAGFNFSLALRNDGKVVAWGSDRLSECQIPAGLSEVKAIAAADGAYSLALKSDGTVVAWGDATWGGLSVPSGLKGVKAIAAGGMGALALMSDGTVTAWGNNKLCTIPPGLAGVTAIAAGYVHAVALLSGGTVVAWGDNQYRQCDIPIGLNSVKAIAAAARCTLVLKSDGTVVAWGDNTKSQCNVPVGLNRVSAVSVGDSFCVALKDDGTVVAWGDNSYSQLNIPVGFNGAIAIAAGGVHTLALKKDGSVDAWGNGYAGECDIPIDFN